MSKKLFVVGIGPGEYEQMTIKAARVLESSQVIVGYTVYTDLIEPYFPGKIFISTPMMQEVKRCRMALLEADRGQVVSMVCSGDPGVYGMAGLILELREEFPDVEVEVVPGVTAACAGAAMLGAPLTHDFAVISLSDLLTPMDLIEKRLEAAAESDLTICIYNPSSKKRSDYLNRACRIVMKYRKEDTVCGIARNIGRLEAEKEIMTLSELAEKQVDMFTTVFIGNSKTKATGGRMVTPRGYKDV